MFTTGGGTMYPFVTVPPPADTGQKYDIIMYANIYVTGSWKTAPNRTFGISRNTNFNIHGTIFLWCLIVATPGLLQ